MWRTPGGKARLPLVSMVALGVLAGGFIGLGALYFTVVISDTSLGFAACAYWAAPSWSAWSIG